MATDLENDLLVLLNDVARHIRTMADQAAQELGMSRAQLIILKRLDQQPDLSQNELAALAEVTPITIARLVDRLEERGLVRRGIDPQDRRIWRLRLTPAAAPFLREIDLLRAKLNKIAAGGIKPAVLQAMAVGLRQMKENVSSRRLAEASSN